MRWVPIAVVAVLGVSAVGAYYEVPSRITDRLERRFDDRQNIEDRIADAQDAAEDAADRASEAAEAAAAAAAVNWDEGDGNNDDETVFSLDQGTGTKNSMALNLPGGFGIKVPMDGKMQDADDFEIDDVGPYPGATLSGVRVRVLKAIGRDDRRSQVELSFKAPASPDAVIDWYAAEFTREGTAFERRGDRLLGRTSEGKAFDLTARPAPGGSTGLARLRETEDS